MAIDKDAAARAIEAFLRALGHDPAEPDLAETGVRVAEAWAEDLLAGERVDVAELLARESFPAPSGDASPLVLLRDAATSTMCPHHLLPALGAATIAYVPGARVAGLGTLARVVDAFARRLTLQERIGEDVAEALTVSLGARGVAVSLRMRHACLEARGERQAAWVETLATRGVLSPGGTHAALLAGIVPAARHG